MAVMVPDTNQRQGASGTDVPTTSYVMIGTVGVALTFANLIAIERPGRPEARVHVNGNTRISVNGRVAKLEDVHPGQSVRAVFEIVGDVAVAVEIAVPSR